MRDFFLPFSSPTIGDEEIAEVVDTLQSGWLTTGPKVHRFEEQFSAYVGCRHAIAVNSCTAALHLALEAIGVHAGDEVITTPMTFAATGEVIHYLGAKPVFVDIDPITMNIDVALLERVIQKCSRPKAILPVHMAGLACEMDPIFSLAKQHGLRVIEDAAHTFPTLYKGRLIGTLGDVTCFSFYSTKTITTGEGGMAVTDNDELAERMRVMSLHGISKNAWSRYMASGSWFYEILAPGFKYNMTDLAAALGLAQLAKADRFHRQRQAIALRYTAGLGRLAEFVETPPDAPAGGMHSWHLYIIKLRLENLIIDRDRFVEELKGEKIGASVHFIPLHLHPYYRETYGYKPADFPKAYETYARIISLPLYPKMTEADVDSVIDAVGSICRKHKR